MRISDWSADVCSSDLLIAQTLQKRQIRGQLPDLTRVAQDEWRDQLARIAQIDRLDLRDREIRDASDLARMGPDLGRGGLGKRAQIEIWNAGGISLPCEDRLLGGAPILSIGKLSSSVRMRARYHCRGNGGARSMSSSWRRRSRSIATSRNQRLAYIISSRSLSHCARPSLI